MTFPECPICGLILGLVISGWIWYGLVNLLL